MIVSLSWLKDYVNIDNIDREEFRNKLIMTGSNAEGVDKRCDEISNVALVRINKIEPHPDAEKLVICTVDLGDEETVVVTGAKNMVVGDYVLLAKHNSRLPNGVKIKKSKLRGVLSNGMFLSYEELGFEKSVIPKEYENGIITYKEPICKLGESPMSNFMLDDYIMDFEITPNRPDCLNMLGMAREVKASFNRDMVKLERFDFNLNLESHLKTVSSSNLDACKRFIGLEIEDVVIKESPQFIKSRLMAYGIRPINNIVDLGNFVMLETGQPVHCYDYDKLNGNLVADVLEKEAEVLCLDDENRIVPKGTIVIRDDKNIVAIAGIMGGKDSSVTENTTKIFLEVANFDATSIRLASKKLGLRSESSSRNEKGINSPLCIDAVERFAYLVEKFGMGKVNKKYFDFNEDDFTNPKIEISAERVNSLLGTEITTNEIISIFELLGFKVDKKDTLTVEIPYYRTDILKDYDLIEEVARIYGYDKIPESEPTLSVKGGLNQHQTNRFKAYDVLTGLGYEEILTYSFIGPNSFDKINIPKDDKLRNYSAVKNPLGEEFSIMRPFLLSSILEIAEYNVKRKNKNLKFFEISSVFDHNINDENSAPIQGENLIMLGEGEFSDYFKLKLDFEKLIKRMNIGKISYKKSNAEVSYHSGRVADVFLNDEKIGVIGEVHPLVLKNYGINTRVSVVEVDFKKLSGSVNPDFKYNKLSKYPSATRDIAILVDKKITNGDIKELIEKTGTELLESVTLFDVYEGENIDQAKKSMAYSLVFRDKNKNLEETEIVSVYEKILNELKNEFSAELRA